MCICTIRLLYNVIRIRDIYSIEYVLRIHSIYLLDSMFDTLCTLERAHTHTHVVRYVDRRIFNVMIMPFVYRTHQHWHDGCVYAGKRPRHSRYQPLNASIGCIYTIIVCVVEARVHWIMARTAGTAYTHTLAITFFFCRTHSGNQFHGQESSSGFLSGYVLLLLLSTLFFFAAVVVVVLICVLFFSAVPAFNYFDGVHRAERSNNVFAGVYGDIICELEFYYSENNEVCTKMFSFFFVCSV